MRCGAATAAWSAFSRCSELPKFITTLTPKLASVIQLPDFNTTLSLARLQRVANAEIRLGALPANFDVKAMYDPPAGT